jgi:hypothetical protein
MKTQAVWVICTGEAHSNPYIDNCGVCMPYWGRYPMCPACNKKLKDTGYCYGCRKHYEMKARTV